MKIAKGIYSLYFHLFICLLLSLYFETLKRFDLYPAVLYRLKNHFSYISGSICDLLG